jgi:branched-chain amino acid transport system substrate-binding protein
MLNSFAITKIQAIVLVSVVVFASIGGVAIYFLLGVQEQPPENIKIGVCADIDFAGGKATLQGAILAAEQVNAEGGILGRNITIVAEDDDTLTSTDPTIGSNALTKLIIVDKADFIITSGIMSVANIYQEIVAEHKKILFHFGDNRDSLTQKVLDNYDRYKYYFRCLANETAYRLINNQVYLAMREYTGFNKVAVWGSEIGMGNPTDDTVAVLNELGFEVVHTAAIPSDVIDFSSYFAQAEAQGAEVIIPLIWAISGGIPLVKEYNVRQSPTVIWGLPYVASQYGWEYSGGLCNYVTSSSAAVVAGYPLTSKVIPTREAYFERWGEPLGGAYIAFAYDVVRFILPDAIERAGTIETDAVIAALEKTEIEETSLYQDFAFDSSHDVLVRGYEDHIGSIHFQWQDGELVPIYPQKFMEEAEATYIFPDWSGPWDDIS